MVSGPPSPPTVFLDRLRQGGTVGAWLFVGLLLGVSAERRLADAQFNRRSAAPALMSADVPDADEIKIRLLLSAGACVPTTGAAVGRVVVWRLRCLVARRTRVTLDGSGPRAPPQQLRSSTWGVLIHSESQP